MMADAKTSTQHAPVMLNEALGFLVAERGQEEGNKVILDCTLGGGGHTLALLRSDPRISVVGIDKDENAILRLRKTISDFPGRFFCFQGDFRNIKQVLTPVFSSISELFNEGQMVFSGIIADLGMSSDQLDDPDRGFSFQYESALDMRMNRRASLTAETVLNQYSPVDLKRVFQRGGVGQASLTLAREIVSSRPLQTTVDFKNICERVINRYQKKSGRSQSHPATVPFQAVRMEVNGEIAAIEGLLSQALELLAPAGRLLVITFHSLEDKLVTRAMRQWSREAQTLRGLAYGSGKPLGKLLTKDAVVPSPAEIEVNPRARSAKIRVFEKAAE